MKRARKYLILTAWLFVTLAELVFAEPVTVVIEPPAWELNGNILTITRPCKIKVTPEFSADLARWRQYDSPETPFTRIKVTSEP